MRILIHVDGEVLETLEWPHPAPNLHDILVLEDGREVQVFARRYLAREGEWEFFCLPVGNA